MTDATRSHVPTAEPPVVPLPAGRDRYEFGAEIARGGMGIVVRARDRALDRDVAVKVLQEKFATDSAAASRFLDEARITGQLQHPGIPAVHDLGTLPDGRPFLAMKLIEGRTLAALLGSASPPVASGGLALPIFEAIGHAVAYAHSRGIIHRDLKPANIMVGAFGEVQVMDWGLAKRVRSAERGAQSEDATVAEPDPSAPRSHEPDPDRTALFDFTLGASAKNTRTGQAVGTPAFMPPEQARGELERIDARSDVFGLGGVLAAMLTGAPPFVADSSESTRLKAERGDLTECFARLDACGADPDVIALAKRCLAADPDERPADAAEVVEAVAALRTQAEERARVAELNRVRADGERATAEARLAEQRKKRRVQVALALAAAALVAGAAGFAWWRERQAAERSGELAAEATRRELEAERAREQSVRLIALAVEMRREARYAAAAEALIQARDAAAAAAPDRVPAVEHALAELAFVRELDAIRTARSTWIAEQDGTGLFDVARAPAAYRAAFAARGLDVLADAEAVGAQVAAAGAKAELLAALDDWAVLEPDAAVRDGVLAAARRADPDPDANRFREPSLWATPELLLALAENEEADRLSPGLRVALAVVLMHRGVNAAPLLRRGLVRQPREFLYPFVLGQVLVVRNPADPEALGAFRTARALRPDHVATLNNLGTCLAKAGDRVGAIATYREAIRIGPPFALVYWNLGFTLKSAGDLPGAVAAYKDAARIDPQNAAMQNSLGIALYEAGDRPGAIAAFRAAIHFNPQHARAHYHLGTVLAANRDFANAVPAFRESIQLDPKFAPAYFNLGNALAAQKDYRGAAAAYREAVRLDPQHARAHLNLGNALTLLGDTPAALDAYREAVRLDPGFAPAHVNLALALETAGDRDAAIASVEEALRLDPGNAAYAKFLTQLRAAKAKRDALLPVAPPPREAHR